MLHFIIFLLFAATSCSPHRMPSVTAAPYHPLRIASGVPAQPGSAAWSPDGKRIAFITMTVNIFNRERGTFDTVKINDPAYLLWTTEQELLVLARTTTATVLCIVNPDTLAVSRHALDRDARAIYSLDRDRILLLSAKRSLLKFGIEMNYTLTAYDRRGNTQKDVYSFNKIYPRNTPEELLTAWLDAGLDPLNDSLLVMELVTPPVVMPHTRLQNIDISTGETYEVAAPQKTVYSGTSWSPDGRRLALSDYVSGHITIKGLPAGSGLVEAVVNGFHPAWNPKGSLLYIGGYLVQSNGKTETTILPDPRGIGWWSGDGTQLAVASFGELWLFDSFSPVFLPPDSPPAETLKNKLSRFNEELPGQ